LLDVEQRRRRLSALVGRSEPSGGLRQTHFPRPDAVRERPPVPPLDGADIDDVIAFLNTLTDGFEP
jgi:hypothetical protein